MLFVFGRVLCAVTCVPVGVAEDGWEMVSLTADIILMNSASLVFSM